MPRWKGATTGPRRWLRAGLFGIVLVSLGGCGGGGSVELHPQPRDGLFYTVLADAQKEAALKDKLILLEMWRPG